jgi:hypothetical protein
VAGVYLFEFMCKIDGEPSGLYAAPSHFVARLLYAKPSRFIAFVTAPGLLLHGFCVPHQVIWHALPAAITLTIVRVCGTM